MMRVLCFLPLIFSIGASASTAEELDKLVLQWTQLEQQYSEIANSWRAKKPLLEQRVTLLQKEKSQLQKQLEQHDIGTGDVEKKRTELLQQQVRLEKEQLEFTRNIAELQLLLKDISTRLPTHLQQEWQTELLKIQELENNSEKLDKQLSLAAQLQAVNQRVSLNVTTMLLPGNEEVQVSQFYIGASHGWYVSNDGRYWGSGSSQLDGWQWQHQDPGVAARDLLEVIAMLNSDKVPALVELPVSLGVQ